LSKQTSICHANELAREFSRLISTDPDLTWLTPLSTPNGNVLPSVDLSFDGKKISFRPFFSLSPSLNELKSLAETKRSGHTVFQPLLVTPRLSSRTLDFCRLHALNAIDLNGRTYIRAKGVLIDRKDLPGRNYIFELEPRNVFVGKSARIVRSLLSQRDRLWAQSELVVRSQASSGLVSRITKHLTHQGYLEKIGARSFRVHDAPALLDDWASADNFAKRATTAHYSAFGNSPLELAKKIEVLLSDHSIKVAFTQWIAGWLRHPYAEPVVVSAYASHLPSDKLLETIGLRPVTEAGNLWLHVPDDEGVFLEIQKVSGLPLVSDAQIYLDLLKTGLRGPDQAEALRNWEGFCRK
jgi:hypothetical protein